MTTQAVLRPTILITGATGNIGTELVKILVNKNVPFRVMVRKEEDAQRLCNAGATEAILGDFDDSASLERALTGIERAFLLTNSSSRAQDQQITFVDAAHKMGVKHLVKLSQWAADEASPVRFLRYHATVEKHIKEMGFVYTFLRPNLFMQALLGFKDQIMQGRFFAPIGDAAISLVDVRDIAAVAAEALTGNTHENTIYNITGPEALTHAQLAEKLTSGLGLQVTFNEVTPQDMLNGLQQAGFPEWQAEGLIEDYAHYAHGEAAEISPDTEAVTGQPARKFADFLKDYKDAFLN